MMDTKLLRPIFLSLIALQSFLISCEQKPQQAKTNEDITNREFTKNIIDYVGVPDAPRDRNILVFSDQGAWFGFSLPDNKQKYGGFTGPFLMTQQNGVWASKNSMQVNLVSQQGNPKLNWENALIEWDGTPSRLYVKYEDAEFQVEQQLTYLSGHTALVRTIVQNVSGNSVDFILEYSGELFTTGLKFQTKENLVQIDSEYSNAKGYLKFLGDSLSISSGSVDSYRANSELVVLEPGESKSFLASQTFIFPEYSWDEEQRRIEDVEFGALLEQRSIEKEQQLNALLTNQPEQFKDSLYSFVLEKSLLTLQNNWRIPAGELKHQGLFPSYHYEWFHGFWSWDSWKHSVGLSAYAPKLAKDQIRAMFDFQKENGFIVDCVYRDTTIEAHNYRDTKPPLAAWAVAKVLRKNPDPLFASEMYPKLKKYHLWWYTDRDHDQDGLCEYGSTDGTVIAAKWESGMDNAIRFDSTKMLQNSKDAFSMDQENVDLNAFLYAEKGYLAEIATILGLNEESSKWKQEASELKTRIQTQFFDEEAGWFYDTNLDGDTFIKGAGSEGWIPLWAKVANEQQAEIVKNKMMDPKKFNVKVPFQTMAADHPKFDPMNGYWRGPNWLDQAYFGIKGIRNYGYEKEANEITLKLLIGAEGLLEKGKPIHENYHPLTGKGLYAKNFSWSAAHLIMLLTNDE
ncbi:trehalase [Muricauda sp. 2012CJ35-5]|uniref:Trehalase n=1 Tax=Flagellimonas spongiicola TaxID=2942208 RepID=A0ABT0PQV2_9FLAO|nr:trehalase family glycosidase [Allomuricauda spongiicola]MCL6273775.1 trehalase [Allomuricauda spongiicola]